MLDVYRMPRTVGPVIVFFYGGMLAEQEGAVYGFLGSSGGAAMLRLLQTIGFIPK